MMLRHLKEQQKLGWKEIAAHFPNRTTNACQFRWRRLKSGTLRTSTNGSTGTTSASSNTSSHINSHHDPSHRLVSGLPTSANDTTIFRTAYPEPGTRNWSRDEDELILSRTDLRVEELSLLLPQRNETEIWHRRTDLANSQYYQQQQRYQLQQQQQQQQQQPVHGYNMQTGMVHLNNNYAVSSMSSNYSTTRRSSVDPVTLVQPNPSAPQSSSYSTSSSSCSRQPPKLHSKKNTHFDNLRLPPPVSQRPPH